MKKLFYIVSIVCIITGCIRQQNVTQTVHGSVKPAAKNISMTTDSTKDVGNDKKRDIKHWSYDTGEIKDTILPTRTIKTFLVDNPNENEALKYIQVMDTFWYYGKIACAVISNHDTPYQTDTISVTRDSLVQILLPFGFESEIERFDIYRIDFLEEKNDTLIFQIKFHVPDTDYLLPFRYYYTDTYRYLEWYDPEADYEGEEHY